MFFFSLFFFIIGSAVGSFLNVVIDRATRGQSILGRSYCDRCKATLASVDLVPIVSFVALSGRCRYCRRPISWQYPSVEALTGFLFVLSFMVLSAAGQLILSTLSFWLFLVSVLIVVAVVDLKFSLIPTTFVFAASLISLFYNYFSLPSDLFVEHIFSAFALSFFFALIVLVTGGRGMGQGDIVLAFLIGLTLGVKGTFLAVFLAFFVGACVSLLLILAGKKRFGQTVPFAPFLVFGFLISLFWSTSIIGWYLMLY